MFLSRFCRGGHGAVRTTKRPIKQVEATLTQLRRLRTGLCSVEILGVCEVRLDDPRLAIASVVMYAL